MSYGHADGTSLDDFIIASAVRRGMDGDAVAELLRTKQPVVRVKLEPGGVKKTTTYSMDSDGSISANTVVEVTAVKYYNTDTAPDSFPIEELRNSPSGTVTRTITDRDGTKHTQTFSIDKSHRPSAVPEVNHGDWFGHLEPTWGGRPSNVFRIPEQPRGNNLHKTTRVFIGPNGERRVEETYSSDPEITPKTHGIRPSNWPNFGFPEFTVPVNTMGDPDDWTVIEENPDDETANSHQFPPGTPQLWNSPYVPSIATTTTTTTTTTPTKEPRKTQIDQSVTKPFPSLEEFLKNQYGPNTRTASTTITPTTSSTKQPVIINIEDLPVTDILHNGKPANETFMKSLPPHLVPTLDTGNVLNIENKHPIDTETTPKSDDTSDHTTPKFSPEDVEIYDPLQRPRTPETNTLIAPKQNPDKECDNVDNGVSEKLEELLKNVGISPCAFLSVENDTIAKTEFGPMGLPISTRYKLTPISDVQSDGPISDYLSKVGLTKSDVFAQNGQYTKTIIEEDGHVLTATYMLSRPINMEAPKKKPYK